MIGKQAIEIEARDLDSGKLVKLADFRGKVIVLDFWGYWCGPCTIELSEYFEISKRFAKEPVVFLALHDASVQSREAYDRHITSVRDKLWGGRDLPFGVLLDQPQANGNSATDRVGTGKTIRRYGIIGFPTTLVIDQKGIVAVRVTSPEQLEAVIWKTLSTHSASLKSRG
jgi:thiol-disulfide isomerase/thioredoxin